MKNKKYNIDHISHNKSDDSLSNLEVVKKKKNVSNPRDININKYKRRGSYRGDSPLDD